MWGMSVGLAVAKRGRGNNPKQDSEIARASTKLESLVSSLPDDPELSDALYLRFDDRKLLVRKYRPASPFQANKQIVVDLNLPSVA